MPTMPESRISQAGLRSSGLAIAMNTMMPRPTTPRSRMVILSNGVAPWVVGGGHESVPVIVPVIVPVMMPPAGVLVVGLV